MNEKLKSMAKKIKNPKILIIVGLAGIVLIFISSLFPSAEKNNSETSSASQISIEEYRLSVEESIKEMVTGITGDENPTVVVTLESGIRYTYADSTKSDSSDSTGSQSRATSESLTQSYITVKDADGGEKPLVISELMPQIRGVAIICIDGDNTETVETVENAVTAALNITSKRVYIAGGKVYEKR